MKYWENGFYLEQNSTNTRVEITDEYWRALLSGQDEGLQIYDDDGYPRLRKQVLTQQEINEQFLYNKKSRLEELTKDLAQVQAGLVVPDIEEKKVEFQTLLNEVRVLEGKEPREVNYAIDSE